MLSYNFFNKESYPSLPDDLVCRGIHKTSIGPYRVIPLRAANISITI